MSDRARRVAAVTVIATAIAVPAEGLRQWAYYDPPGILTVCYGHTGEVEKGRKYSLDECKALLTADMLEAVEAVEACHPALPQNVHAAFADAVFNIGPKVACDSTASRLLEAGNYEDACRELPRWNKSRVAGVLVPLPGLTKRRNAEMLLCLS
jgi:GH24 family phage-related lysozyme (muramidase)